MSMFTKRQREILHRRLARELCWRAAIGYQSQASQTATHVLDELERLGFDAGTQRRAVERIVAAVNDDATPLRSVSPVERDAKPVADATELDSGVAS